MQEKYPCLFAEYEDVLSVDDVMKYLDVSRNTVYSLLKSRKIKGKRIGRTWKISRARLIEYLEK